MKNKLLVGLSFFAFMINVFNVTTSAQIETSEMSLDLFNCESDKIQMEFDDRPYFISEFTDVIIKIDSLSDIRNVKYDYNGFEVIQFNRELNDSFKVRLGFSENVVSMNFKLIVKLSNDNVLVANIYGYQSNDLFFLSRSSTENTDLLYYDYAFRTNIITKEQYEEILFEKSCLAKENFEMSNSQIEDISNQFSTLSSTSQASIVSGTWQWIEGGIAHPLKYTTVNVKYSGSNNLPVTASTSTDENGYFSIELMISNTVDVKVQVFSSGTMTNVRKNSFSYPYSYITASKSLNPGGSISFDFILDNEEDINFKAFQISQALIMGEKYVESMTGEMAPSINCHFPKDGNDYDDFLDVINITEPASDYWDIVLHEYGHKVMDYYELDDYLGDSHGISEDLIKRYNKVKGIGMAWGEGWSTFFAILVTQYYGSELNNIPFTNDDIYHHYYFNDEGEPYPDIYSLEAGRKIEGGEGCEAAVFSVLYDFYDAYSASEPWDNLSYSHRTMFNAVINSKATTFSVFLNYFVNNYYSANDGKIGNILSHYGMSPTHLRISSGTLSYTTPPTFSWEAGGPASCNYNSFELAFYNSKKAIILTTEKQSNTTLELTLEQWNKIWDSDTTSVFVMVIAYQTSTPSTGPYYSVQLEISRPSDAPHMHNYTYKYTDIHTHKATCACGDSFLQAHYFITERQGQRCKYCRYYTEGPVITPEIMNANLITKEDLYIPRKETIEVIEHI